jgi:putative ABC transport system permease protein
VTSVSTWGAVASAALIVLALALSRAQSLGLERDLVAAALRAAAQLFAVGVGLHLVIDDDRPVVLAIIWVAAMIVIAGATVRRRAPEVPQAERLAVVSFVAATAVGLGVLLGFRVYPPTGRSIVLLAGMLIGNSLAATVSVARRIVSEVAEGSAEIEARLALGESGDSAIRPFTRKAIRTGLTGPIETNKAVGIIALPGTMVGQLLAGAEPLAAVKAQLTIMYLILGAVATTTAIVGVGLSRQLITPDQRLVHLERQPAP